jgi:hypothetical protein
LTGTSCRLGRADARFGVSKKIGCPILRVLAKGGKYASPAAGRPFGFNFNGSGFTGDVVVEAAPAIVFWLCDQATLYRVAMDVAELFDLFLRTGDIEVVIATLPELLLVGWLEFPGGELLEDLEEGGEGVEGWFVGEQVDMLGHEDIGRDEEALLPARLFQESLDGVFYLGSVQEGLTFVATEGDEVEVAGLLKAFEARWHGGGRSLYLYRGWGWWRVERVVRAVYIPPFAKARRMGHPRF